MDYAYGIAFYARLERSVPALSKSGLIALAGTMGIAGFMVIRRKLNVLSCISKCGGAGCRIVATGIKKIIKKGAGI